MNWINYICLFILSLIACFFFNRRYDRLRVSTFVISPILAAGTGKILFSGIHFPNVDGQPPGMLMISFLIDFCCIHLVDGFSSFHFKSEPILQML